MDGQTAFVSVAAVTPNLAGVFGLRLDDGVVISHRMWQREFGASVDVIGEEIRINSVTARISGIAPDWLEGIYRDRPVDVWMPLPEETLQRLDDSSRNLWVVARLGRDISPSQAKEVVQPGVRANELRVLPYTGLSPERAARLSRIGTLLEFAAGGVFFIACVNVGLFLLGRSEEHTSNSSHSQISYAVFCLKKKKEDIQYARNDMYLIGLDLRLAISQ